MKTTVDIIGGAGYVGGEMIRLLLNHPECEIKSIKSNSQAGRAVSDIHKDLIGWTDLTFDGDMSTDADVTFICMGHGRSKSFLSEHHPPGIVIDLSRDFRLKEHGSSWIYGLCELNKTHIQNANLIANPGCFASCIQLGLLPLADQHKLNNEIHVTAITGSTGAGQNPVSTTHNSWRNNNISIYKAFGHQHLDEIRQSILQLQADFNSQINFIPMRGSFTRGIFASIYLDSSINSSDARTIYQKYYSSSPFVHIVEKPISVKEVVNTNNTLIYIESKEGKLRIECALDNLIKGAAGQAIQNLNLRMGWPETSGLRLKGSTF